jgi:hypothetical protein
VFNVAYERCYFPQTLLTPKIPGPFLPISITKMLIFSKKSPKKLKNVEISTPERL